MPNTWQFVDSPTASPTVLLNMNDGSTWKTLGGEFFKLPSPPLKRSIATNAMTDGGVLTSAAYDLRTLVFTLDLCATTDSGRIAQLNALKAELAKPTNLIMHQLQTASFPVFFRTYRSDEYTVDTEISQLFWRVSCEVLAEPFAIGIRRDLPSVTVSNDPATGTNPTRFDLTGIVGDAPTPAFAQIVLAGGAGARLVLATRSNNPSGVTVVAQAEAGVMGTDTSVQANDAAMSGAGSNYTRTTFATSSILVNRVTVTIPSGSDQTALRGRYRIFVRVRASAGGSTYTLRYRLNSGGSDFATGPLVNYTGSTTPATLDLGVIDYPPPGPSPITLGYSGLQAAYAGRDTVIQASRNSGTASLDIDYVYAMPADERMCSVQQVANLGSLILDGPNDATYGMAAGSTPFGATRVVDNAGGLTPRIGGLPLLVPGVTNRWYLLATKAGVTATSTVNISYWPRWREVATS